VIESRIAKPNTKDLIPGILAALVMLAFVSASCSTRTVSADLTVRSESPEIPGLFRVPENQLPNLKIEAPRREIWASTVRTTGTVDWDGDHTTLAISRASGPVTKILVDTGSRVQEGDVLLYVASSDITNALAVFRKAQNHMDFETRTLERNRDLLEHKAIAQKDLESVQSDYNDASTDLQNALQTLRTFGITEHEIEETQHQGAIINPELALRAPISGVVVQKLVFPGQLVQAGNSVCFAISDVSKVWIQGHIYEKDLTSLRVGDPVESTNSALPGAFRGSIAYIGSMLDPSTRTTPVRIVTENPNGMLRKDLFVDLTIHTGNRRNVLTVPTSAVLYDADNMPFVYVRTDGTGFAQRMVALGGEQNERMEIVNGLKDGENVVSQGGVFLQFANTFQK
jgi:membrane fusion protein, heavy metal efflux system